MNRTDITFSTIRSAAKHYWKKSFVIVLICAVLGAGFGAWYAPKSAVSEPGCAQALTSVSFTDILRDEYYYARCAKRLNNEYTTMESYLETLKKEVGQSEKSDSILALYERLEEMKATDFTPIKESLSSSTLYILPDSTSAALTKCPKKIDAANYSSSDSYLMLLSYKKKLNTFIEQLENQPEEIAANAKSMDDMLTKAAEDINSMQPEINQIAEQVALQNNVNIRLDINMGAYTDFTSFNQFQFIDKAEQEETNETEEKATSVVTLHISRTTSANEAFWATVITLTLFGICGSMFWAVCKETASAGNQDTAL